MPADIDRRVTARALYFSLDFDIRSFHQSRSRLPPFCLMIGIQVSTPQAAAYIIIITGMDNITSRLRSLITAARVSIFSAFFINYLTGSRLIAAASGFCLKLAASL